LADLLALSSDLPCVCFRYHLQEEFFEIDKRLDIQSLLSAEPI